MLAYVAAKGRMLSVAPKSFSMGCRNTIEIIMMTAPTDMLLYKAVLATLSAFSLSPRPNNREM